MRHALGLVFLVLIAAPASAASPGEAIQAILAGEKAPDFDIGDIDIGAVRSFYQQRGYAPCWSGSARSGEQARILVAALSRAADDGLDPADYTTADIHASDASVGAAERDILLSDRALRFARDMRLGRPDLRAIDRDVDLPAQDFDPAHALASAVQGGSIAAFLASLAPTSPDYGQLKAALRQYAAIADGGGWPMLSPAPAKDFATDDGLSGALRQRLAREDESALTDQSEGLAEAVKRFQLRHGLDADGRVGPITLRALNVPASARVLEIVANMERWRWMPRAPEPAYIIINVADARLKVVIQNRIALESPVIVGGARRPTPILRAMATSVTINPPWNVPPRIARQEILPKLQADPGYLQSQDMVLVNGPANDPYGLGIDWHAYSREHFPFLIRQLPGDKNALGHIKLELPNPFDVYLHDTPGQAAFALNERYLSHGCVRVEAIKNLASYALSGDPDARVVDLEAAIAAGETQHWPISQPLPVYFLYWTAFVDDDGAVEFREDIYGRDQRLIAKLAKPQPRQQFTYEIGHCAPA